MAANSKYNPRYDKSWALVIGINEYTRTSPLSYACNDATVFASYLIDRFGFPKDQVTVLLDDEATLERIRAAMGHFVRSTAEDDRVVIFYAGHGHTVPGNRREAGYLVPVGGDGDDISTLLPWDELVSNGNVIRAKHILYVMDACYGGLIATRKLAPGTARIARDMLSRYSRQYLTAGKADELVADGGGPRKGHSMFTGHLLEALDGAVQSPEGIITTNSVIAYVYDRVAKDPHSHQTPHYGWLEGDGDLFFTDPKVDPDPSKPKDVDDLMIEVPPDLEAPADVPTALPLLEQVKEYLSDRRYRIQLNDLVMRELRVAQQHLAEERFPLQDGTMSGLEIFERLQDYEVAVSDVLRISVLLGKWAENEQQSVVRQLVHLLAGQIDAIKSGRVVWLGLRSYPMLMTMYVGGIAAIDGDNYPSLQTLFSTQVPDRLQNRSQTALQATAKAILQVDQIDGFKQLPNFRDKYAPRSEYLFTQLQPVVEDILFLGTRYEKLFDRFEVLYALNFADMEDDYWGPPGRFGWKHRSRMRDDPFNELLEEAKRDGDQWAPLRAGMFRGSYARFAEVAERFKTGLLDRLSWY